MLLKSNFFKYQVLESSDETLIVNVKLNALHEVYKGHFPEQPIVPGVCQVQMIKEIMEIELGKRFLLSSARDIKFVTMINPNNVGDLRLEITYQIDDSNVSFSAILQDDNCKYTKIRATLAAC